MNMESLYNDIEFDVINTVDLEGYHEIQYAL